MIKKLALWAVVLVALLVPLSAGAAARYSVIMLGDKDEYVLKLQKELYARGYLETEPTGYFGDETQHALMRYQERNGIKADGKAGIETQKKIYGKNYKAIPSTRKVTENKENSKADTPDSFRPGDSGDKVKSIQKRLEALGYCSSDMITGDYGPETEEAVRSFQKNNGLKVDGVVGSNTHQAIFASTAKALEDAEVVNEAQIIADAVQAADAIQAASANQTQEGQTVNTAPSDKAVSLIEFGKKQMGKPYRSGAEGPSSFDCSGFVYYCLRNAVGIKPPRSSTDQSRYEVWAKITDKSALRMGDIVFFKTRGHPNDVGHSGIYIGNGKFIHSSSGKGVIISDLSVGYYLEHYQWARRALA